jgi:folate-binding Fe-S cluster repair protein YgfZ
MNNLDTLQWRLIRVRGVDRLSYLQGQLTQDIASAEFCYSLVLQPSGEVLSDLEVSIGDECIELVVPDSLAEAVLARLRRFVLRVDATFEDCGPAIPVGGIQTLIDEGRPSGFEWALSLPPHSYGQQVVDRAVSFTKGCFTGQELVGRADARGATMPWRLINGVGGGADAVSVLLQGAGPEGPQGVTSFCFRDGATHWRGVAHRSFDPSILSSVGAELTFFA